MQHDANMWYEDKSVVTVTALKPRAPSYLEKTANSANRGHAMLSFFCMSFLISKEEICFEDNRTKRGCSIRRKAHI